MIVVASWIYLGSGYETEGEAWLARRRLLVLGKRGGSPRRN